MVTHRKSKMFHIVEIHVDKEISFYVKFVPAGAMQFSFSVPLRNRASISVAELWRNGYFIPDMADMVKKHCVDDDIAYVVASMMMNMKDSEEELL